MKLFVEFRQCVLQYLRDTLRKNLMQIAERHAGTIRRLDASKRRARSVCEKIPHQLRRRVIILPACRKSCPLELLLIPYAAERPLVRERRFLLLTRDEIAAGANLDRFPGVFSVLELGAQRDEKRGVRVLAVSRAVAHAVCNNAPFFGCRCDHIAARAHAERVRACAVRELDVQLIVRRTERRVLRKRTVLAVANHALRVLDANAH